MAPKRKTSSATISSFYQLHGSSASKRRLLLEEEEDEEAREHSSSHLRSMSNTNQVLVGHSTTPSLEYITTNLSNLQAPFPLSKTSTPVTPESTHNIVPPPPQAKPPPGRPQTYLILGASRGIGLEFARQLLQLKHQVIAVVRDPSTASQLWQVTGNLMSRPGSCIIEQCDVGSSPDIAQFVSRMRLFVERGGNIDSIILNAGILDYEKGLGALNVEFDMLERHLRVNCVGNVVLARKLLMLNDLPAVQQRREQEQALDSSDYVLVGRQVVFMSSDSGSMTDFREYEDGFAAYGASKVALNMMIRHMAAELKRRAKNKEEEAKIDWQSRGRTIEAWEDEVCVLAMHPGEVSTDMANVELGWEVEGVITAEQSVRAMLDVLHDKKSSQSGTFWRWDGTQHPW